MKVIGTAVFYYGEEIITQTPVYEGEAFSDLAVYQRAYKGLEMLDQDKLSYIRNSKPKFYPLVS